MSVYTSINIYQYKNPLSFLIAYFESEKAKNKNLSIRKFAKLIQVDEQDLLLVIKNKKQISSTFATKLSKGLNLNLDEEIYFLSMVKFVSSTNLKERQVMEVVLAELSKENIKTVYVEDESIFNHWVHMAILSMTKIEGINLNKASIGDLLCDEVSPSIIDEALERLLRLELIYYDENGNLKKKYANTTSKNDTFKKSPYKYYEQVAELSKRGVLTSPEEREYQCFSLAIKQDKIATYKNLIRDFRNKICALAENEPSDIVYQFNMQFFPLTKSDFTLTKSEIDSLDLKTSSDTI